MSTAKRKASDDNQAAMAKDLADANKRLQLMQNQFQTDFADADLRIRKALEESVSIEDSYLDLDYSSDDDEDASEAEAHSPPPDDDPDSDDDEEAFVAPSPPANLKRGPKPSRRVLAQGRSDRHVEELNEKNWSVQVCANAKGFLNLTDARTGHTYVVPNARVKKAMQMLDSDNVGMCTSEVEN